MPILLPALALALAAAPPPASSVPAAVPATAAPLTLDDALAEAARASHDLRLARNAREAAGVEVYGSYAGVLPRLDLSAAAGRDFVGGRSSVQVVPVLDPATGAVSGFDRRVVRTPARDEADYAIGLVLRQPIFDGLASWKRIAAAQAGERAAERQVDERGLAVSFEVTRLFYGVVEADESLRVLAETVRRSEEVLVRTEALFEAGRAPKSEVIQARVNLENDRLRVETQRALAGQARAGLAAALGREAAGELEVVPPAPVTGAPAPGGEPPPLEVLVARARARRPLLAAQDALLDQSRRGAEAARAAFWPVLSLQAAYNRQGPELVGTEGVLGDPSRQYVGSAQLVLSWNLFAGRETTAAARQAELAVRRAEIEADQARTLVASELAAARATASALGRAIGIAQAALGAAEEGQRAARERFEVGVANQLEVRDAELKLTQARLALLQSRIDEAVARADLARAAGGPLD